MNEDNRLKILIVDDEPLITMFLKRIIDELGEEVVGICHDSHQALEAIKKEKLDLIFMDINIKGPLDGISVIKKIYFETDASVIYVSSYDDSEILDEALSTKPNNYLIKPIREEDVKIAITLVKQALKKTVAKPSNRLYFAEQFYYDRDTQELVQNGGSISLSIIEKKLLDLFVKNLNINLSTEDIKNAIWEDKSTAGSTVRDKVSKLRKKIPELPIKTNFGRGYILSVHKT